MKGGLISKETITCFHTSACVSAELAVLLRGDVKTSISHTETAVTDVFRALASG